MLKIVTLAGTNSQDSINNSLIAYTKTLMDEVEFLNIDLNDYLLPIFGVDYEAENGLPAAVKRLDKVLDQADGFMLSLAEHNGSYSAVFKNTLDWLSRINLSIWRDKPMLLMATSPGGRGGASVLEAAKANFPFMGAQISATFSLPSYYDNFSKAKIVNPALEAELMQKVKQFNKDLNLNQPQLA